MTWWDEKATRWQQRNRDSEATHGIDFSENEARQAVIYTREDITMVVAYLSALNQQIATAKAILAILMLIALYAAVILTFR